MSKKLVYFFITANFLRKNFFSFDLTFWALRCLDYKKVLPLCEILTQIDYEE